MAEYAWVMKQWQRMCGSMQGGIAKCDNCPLLKVICQYKPNEKVHFAEAEKIITDWAAKNPEPVYPTWREWLISIGVIGQMSTHSVIADTLSMTPIPADIAQKLGIESKEVG